MEHSDLICVKTSKAKGRGVFAKRAIGERTLIERVPVLIVPIDQIVDGLHNVTLQRYFFVWSKNKVAIALGYGSLYNHSFDPNAHYEFGRNEMRFRARRDIHAGEEITINYNGDPIDQEAVGFSVV